MRNKTFFIVFYSFVIYANIALLNAKNDFENSFESNDAIKEFSETLETSTDESKDDKDACQTRKDCSYRGTCKEDEQGQKTCHCLKGIRGKKCEIINECVENPSMCGEGTDVECEYNLENKKAFCECTNETKRFDMPQKKCVDQKPCLKQKQCLNGGVCTKRGDTRYCDCKLGTSGDFCERIEDCINQPKLCGDGNDVKCEFNIRQNRVYCQCENQNLRYDWPQKKCVERKSCDGNNECLPFGQCANRCQDYEPCYSYTHIEDKYSCHCVEGTSGEKCEIVDDCYNKVVDCGSGDNVVCTYSYIRGFKGYTYCKCKNDTQRFDSFDKLCKDCDCGAMGDTCNFSKGQKKCTCKPLSYNFGDRCEDCKCGEGSKGCSFEGENKTCLCNPGFVEFNGRCERCDCGKNSKDCKFSNGKKNCTCEPGFTEGNYGICTPMCNDTRKCANGGLCLQNVCVCLAGTRGPFCETVIDCESKMCGIHQNVSCLYDSEKQRAFCLCRNSDSLFDTFDKTCKMCECYRWSFEKVAGSCEFVRGKKVCHCKEDYAYSPVINKCDSCECGSNSTSCKFDQKGKIFCGCEDGFVDISGRCTKCDCGNHGVCRYIEEANKYTKVCACDAGYEDYKGNCVKCDCGPNGKCNYLSSGKTKSCSCDTGYAEDTGKCKLCDCGPDSKCSFKLTRKYCQCPTGFQSVRGYCRDIDECLNALSCPERGSLCINTIGSFKCSCKPGFILRESNAKETTPLCRKQEVETPNYTQWKIGYGILSVGFVAVIIGLVIVIFKIRRN